MLRRTVLRLAAALAALALAPAALAQYPNRPITLIVPWGAGGGTDATARILASIMEKELKQPINVVNRTGGSGVVGHSAIAEGDARRLHDRPHHGRDRDDALAGPHQAHGRVVHAARPGERRSGRPAGPRRLAVQDGEGAASTRSRRTRASSRPPAPGRAASGTSRSPACCKSLNVDPATRRPGCRRTARRPDCRTSSPAASRSCRARSPRRAR